jgi:co-chaperonin GroES (HSP10)
MMTLFDEQLPANLPRPAGWRILIKPIRVQQRTAGGIELPVETQESMGYLRTVGQVIAMGPDCYAHPKFCGAVPWCQIGDWVRYHQHTGQKELVRGDNGEPIELRYINDDEVLGVASDPGIWMQEL